MKERLNREKTQRWWKKEETGSKSIYLGCLNTEYQSILLGNLNSYTYWAALLRINEEINNNQEIFFSYGPRINSDFL